MTSMHKAPADTGSRYRLRQDAPIYHETSLSTLEQARGNEANYVQDGQFRQLAQFQQETPTMNKHYRH